MVSRTRLIAKNAEEERARQSITIFGIISVKSAAERARRDVESKRYSKIEGFKNKHSIIITRHKEKELVLGGQRLPG